MRLNTDLLGRLPYLMRFLFPSFLALILLGGCDAFSDPPVGNCEAGDQPDLPLGVADGLEAGTFKAQVSGDDLTGLAAFRVDTTLWQGERRAVGVVEMEASPGGGHTLRLTSPALLSPAEGETVRVAVLYFDGSGDAFSGNGDIHVARDSEAGVAGAFAACTSRYPFSALWVSQARAAGGFHAARH